MHFPEIELKNWIGILYDFWKDGGMLTLDVVWEG